MVLTSKKAIICILSIGSIVWASTFKDIRSHTVKKTSSVDISSKIIPVERNVASIKATTATIAQINLLMNVENISKINANWEITRIVGADEKVAFDKQLNPEDAKRTIKVPFELISDGIVRVNNDPEQIYKISLLSEFGTIALFKKRGDGYEIIEANKVVVVKRNTLLDVSEEVELNLDLALNKTKSDEALSGNEISGHVFLNDKALKGLEVEMTNKDGEIQNITIDKAELTEDGTFKSMVNGAEVSGVVVNNGKSGFRINFFTGTMAGIELDFITKELVDKIEETKSEEQSALEPK